MILRFYARDGQFRLDVQPTDDFPSILEALKGKLPEDTDLRSVTISNARNGGDSRPLQSLKGVSFQRVGLKYVSALSERLSRLLTI